VLDVTGDDSECNVLVDRDELEFWGGLYASGHFEVVSGGVRIKSVIEAFGDALKDAGYDNVTVANQAGKKEIALYGRVLAQLSILGHLSCTPSTWMRNSPEILMHRGVSLTECALTR
jgi:hypothetical protein